MAELVIDDLRHGYKQLVETVLDKGEEVSPRGQKTKELRNMTVVLTDPVKALPLGVGRKLNMKIGAVETTQLIAGVSSAMQLNLVSNNRFEAYMNNGRLVGAYGPRLYGQIPTVIQALTEDPDSRQAAALVWRNNELELAMNGNKDVPCTVALSWNIRNNKLNAATVMRSNDVFLGVAYDFWMFTRLQMTLAWALGVEVGDYRHHAISMHAYERDWDKINDIEVEDKEPEYPPAYIPTDTDLSLRTDREAFDRWYWARGQALNVVTGDFTYRGVNNKGPGWYAKLLSEHRATGAMCSSCRYFWPKDSEEGRMLNLRGTCSNCPPK